MSVLFFLVGLVLGFSVHDRVQEFIGKIMYKKMQNEMKKMSIINKDEYDDFFKKRG